MSESKSTVVATPLIGTGTLLGCLFVGLKLTGVISWSWFWVTLPFWAGFAIALAVALVVFVVCAILALILK